MKIALLGATGLVGRTMLRVLEERGFADCDIIPAASPRSIGKTIDFAGRKLTVVSPDDAIAAHPQYAIFSAGASASRQYAPRFVEVGTTVVDNSSCWRMDPNVPLVVPEINIEAATHALKLSSNQAIIIANPNCSTIQMVLALSRLHWRYKIERIVVSTYQSITGTGVKAIRQLEAEEKLFVSGIKTDGYERAYPHQIFRNLFPHGGDFNPDGYTTEEQKLVNETRKILSDPDIRVSATVARVPVVGGHSESVNVEFAEEYDLDEVRRLLQETPGVVLCDDPSQNLYPTPIMAEGKDEVFVGRVRRDPSQPRTLNLWCVSDNLRKGAATNAIQILQALLSN